MRSTICLILFSICVGTSLFSEPGGATSNGSNVVDIFIARAAYMGRALLRPEEEILNQTPGGADFIKRYFEVLNSLKNRYPSNSSVKGGVYLIEVTEANIDFVTKHFFGDLESGSLLPPNGNPRELPKGPLAEFFGAKGKYVDKKFIPHNHRAFLPGKGQNLLLLNETKIVNDYLLRGISWDVLILDAMLDAMQIRSDIRSAVYSVVFSKGNFTISNVFPKDRSLPKGAVARLGSLAWEANGEIVALSPKGTYLLLENKTRDNLLQVMSMETGTVVMEIPQPSPGVSYAFSPDEQKLAVATSRRLYVLSPTSGTLLQLIEFSGGSFRDVGVDFDPSGKRLAVFLTTAQGTRRIDVHDLNARRTQLKSIALPSAVESTASLRFSNDKNTILLLQKRGFYRVDWQTEKTELVTLPDLDPQRPACFDVSRDGSSVLIVKEVNSNYDTWEHILWDSKGNQVKKNWKTRLPDVDERHCEGKVSFLDSDRQASVLWRRWATGFLQLYDLTFKSGQDYSIGFEWFKKKGIGGSIAASRSGNAFATRMGKKVYYGKTEDHWKFKGINKEHREPIFKIFFNDTLHTFSSGSKGFVEGVWKTTGTLENLIPVERPQLKARNIIPPRFGTYLSILRNRTFAGTTYPWETDSIIHIADHEGTLILEDLPKHWHKSGNYMEWAAMTRNERYLIRTFWENEGPGAFSSISVWDLEKKTPGKHVTSTGISARPAVNIIGVGNDHLLLVTYTDLLIYETATLTPKKSKKLSAIFGTHNRIQGIAVHSDSGLAALVVEKDYLGTVRLCLLKLDSMEVIAETPIGANTQALDFSPDGRYLATGGSDTTALIWDVAQIPSF